MEILSRSEMYNKTFYSDSRAYLASLLKKGETDDGFEDEFYFTLPVISANA